MASYKISTVEGIGATYADKLVEAGVRTVNTLLKKGCNREGRKTLSAITGIDESRLLSWVNMADLYRIKGIGSEYAELLHVTGVDTVKEMRTRNAENLLARIVEVNNSHRRVRQMPTLKQVQEWVETAKTLPPVVTH